MKVNFINEESFVIYYVCDEILRTEEELKIFFKMLNTQLKKQYNYEFHGFYNVNIYCKDYIFVMEFENIDDYGRADFNIMMLLNSTLLFEFEDSDMIFGEKIYYNHNYYVELEKMNEDIYLFEYGNIIYGDKVQEILNKGILVTV